MVGTNHVCKITPTIDDRIKGSIRIKYKKLFTIDSMEVDSPVPPSELLSIPFSAVLNELNS